MYFFTNVNLVLPVVAAVVVIVCAIVFICVFRVRHQQMIKTAGKVTNFFTTLSQKKSEVPSEPAKRPRTDETPISLGFRNGLTLM